MKFLNEIWAIIPARSGSKGLKNKNIKLLKGVPLIGHSITAAVKNKYIKKVIFSSDSNKYISIAKKFKCDFYHKRSKINSMSNSKDINVFKEVLQFLLKNNHRLPNYFVHFRPTTPIRKNNTISQAINSFLKRKNSISSLKSVSVNPHNSLKDYIIKNNKLFSLNKKLGFKIDKINIPKEKLPETFIGNGIIDIYKTQNIMKGKLLGEKVYPFITSEIFCDIDSIYDFKYANFLMK